MAAFKSCSADFHRAVELKLQNWLPLRLAIENGMGGSDALQKASWLVDVVDDFYCNNDNLQPDEVEDFIAEILDNEFETYVEDGSLEQLSREMCQIYQQFRMGVLNVESLIPSSLPSLPTVSEPMDESSDEMVTDETKTCGPEENGKSDSVGAAVANEGDAGWTVVHHGKKKHP